MLKKYVILFVLVAAPMFAEYVDCEAFTAKSPQGWELQSEQELGAYLAFSPDQTVAIGIVQMPGEDLHDEEPTSVYSFIQEMNESITIIPGASARFVGVALYPNAGGHPAVRCTAVFTLDAHQVANAAGYDISHLVPEGTRLAGVAEVVIVTANENAACCILLGRHPNDLAKHEKALQQVVDSIQFDGFIQAL